MFDKIYTNGLMTKLMDLDGSDCEMSLCFEK